MWLRFDLWLKYFFRFLSRFWIVSACRFCNACVWFIIIEFLINRASLHFFIFSFFLLFVCRCEGDFSRVSRKWFLLYIMKHSFVDYTLTARVSWRLCVCALHAILFLYDNISITLHFRYLWLFNFKDSRHFLR